MDLFRYNSPTTFLGGESINGYESAAWTERYHDPGTFEIQATLSSGLKDFLPEGTLLGQIKSLDIMLVENHQIVEKTDADPTLTITGRSLQAILEERIVGQNWNWAAPPASIAVSAYILASNYTWMQAAELIDDHITTGTVLMADDAIPLLSAGIAPVIPIVGSPVAEARTLNRDDVLKHLISLLAFDDLGCRVIRRHTFSGHPASAGGSLLYVHGGSDKTNSVIFSTKNGDIDAADYLWSIKKMKTSALVSGKFVETMVHGAETGLNRRVMLVDGQEFDGHLEVTPTGGTLTAIRAAMTVKGTQALKAQKRIALSRIDISSTPTYEFRRDYNIGDIVSVDSSYGPMSTMRVVEYTEIEDENGESAHPTLEILDA